MKITSKQRWASLGLCSGLLFASMLPAMGAAPPTTQVTTKLDAFSTIYGRVDNQLVNQRVISGTAANLLEPKVDIVCINVVDALRISLSSGVPVVNGKWTATINLLSVYGFSACRIAAIPSGLTWGSLGPQQLATLKDFKGPTVTVSQQVDWYSMLGDLNVWQKEKGQFFTANKARGEIWAAEHRGLARLVPFVATNASGPDTVTGYFSRDAGFAKGPTGNDEAGLTVDGIQAFTSYNMSDQDINVGKIANSPKYTFTINQGTGATTYTESSPLFKCACKKYPAAVAAVRATPLVIPDEH
jgi:hypothetical protein